ncbi:MAG: glycosyltransferase family 2 protein [candidate division Zixibacteria bacterium]|nr:glycosyltransferase family 2 protein [candidate division Zixibacteria bacterium]
MSKVDNSFQVGKEKLKVVVVMPAYNAAQTLAITYQNIPSQVVDEVLLVDDASRDETVKIALDFHLKVVRHPHNVGYGGNQKTCYMEALRDGADIVVMLHPDGQYDPRLIPQIIEPIKEGKADFVLGSRLKQKGGALKGGMPLYKFLANRFLTGVENLILGQKLSEMHTGYRAYSRSFLEKVPLLRNSNDFVFDSQIIAQAVVFKQRIAEIPVSTKYFKEASSVNFKVSLIYGFKTLWTVFKFALDRLGIIHSKLFRP